MDRAVATFFKRSENDHMHLCLRHVCVSDRIQGVVSGTMSHHIMETRTILPLQHSVKGAVLSVFATDGRRVVWGTSFNIVAVGFLTSNIYKE